MVMLLAYDIEQNPGANNPRQAELSILHLNTSIRGIRNKIDYIKDNLLDFHFYPSVRHILVNKFWMIHYFYQTVLMNHTGKIVQTMVGGS